MRKRIFVMVCLMSLMGLFVISSLCMGEVSLDKNEPYDKLSGKVVTPHIAWASPYYQGKIKALVIAPMWSQRETIELAQRLSLNYSPIMTFAFDKMYSTRGSCQPSSTLIDQIIQERLKKEYDVIIIGKISWKILSQDARYEILQKIHNGTGLVYIYPHNYPKLEAVFERKRIKDKEAFITTGIPFNDLPVLKNLSLEKLLKLSQFGKGRIVRIDYGQGTPNRHWWHSLTPHGVYKDWSLNYDYYHSFLAKAVLWAACKEPNIYIKKIKATGKLLNVSLLTGKDEKVDLALIIRDRNNFVEQRQSIPVGLKQGMKGFSFKLPSLKAGLHFLDIWVKKDGKVINWGSTSINIDTRYRIEKLVLDKESYKIGDTIQGKAIFNQPIDENLRLRIQLWDNFGRLIHEKNIIAKDKEMSFSLEIKQALSILLKVKAELYDKKHTICEMRKEFSVVQRKKLDDYHFSMWVGSFGKSYIADLVLRQFYESGVDIHHDYNAHGPRLAITARKTAQANLKIVPYLTCSSVKISNNIRKPCLTDPGYRKRVEKKLREDASVHMSYGAPAYTFVQVHGTLTKRAGEDVCFSPTCLEDLRVYLKKEYKSLDALNQEWDTIYKSWDEVMPMTFKEAKEHGNFAPWADHRMHMEEVLTEFLNFYKRTIQDIAPEAIVGFSEPLPTTSYSGYTWWRLMNKIDFVNPYGHSHTVRSRYEQRELERSFNKRKDNLTGIWFGTYRRDEEHNRAVPWQSLFNGMNSVWWWIGFGHNIPALAPDISPLPYFAQAMEETREIKRGIGKLLIASEREDNAIAIHYSPASVHASTINSGNEREWYRSQMSFIHVLEDIGLQYKFVANEQIEEGELEKKKYKVLILPYAQALSSVEVKKIKEFVQRGGLLIADFIPGIMDKHCKKLDSSPLEKVFGGFENKLGLNKYGKGKTVYLGDLLTYYAYRRIKGDEGEVREKIKEILELAGVKPGLRIIASSGKDLGATEVAFFKNGDIEYVCLLRDYSIKDLSKKEVILKFSYKAHIYDVRENKYYGNTDEIKSDISPARAKVFALVPYQITGIGLSLNSKKYNQGETLSYKVKIKGSTDNLSTHAVRLELVNPQGQIVKYYSENLLTKEDTYPGRISLSLNEKKGEWKLRVKDVVSGKVAEKGFTVN